MTIWTSEIKELERLYDSFKNHLPVLEKEIEQLIKTEDANVVMLYSRRCLEVIVTDLCECELKRQRKTEPLKGIIDKLNSEEKVPSHIITSMHGLNSLSTYGTHPKEFDPDQVKPVLSNLAVIIKWYLKYKNPKNSGFGIEKINAGLPLKNDNPNENLFEHKNELGNGKTKHYKKKWRLFTIGPSAVLLVAIVIFLFSSGSTLPFSKRDWVVITDFENLTGNPVFDKSLYTAFTITANQSRYINVFPKSRMIETLTRMENADKANIDEKTGREIALREGINIYIIPGISEVGKRYAVTAKILETKTGDLLRSEILYAETKDEILLTLDQLCKKIRRTLGESRYNIAIQDKPLKKVTTSSLEALKLYSLGTDHLLILDYTGARDYYKDALRIDTGFTAAKASLGSLLMERFNDDKGRELLNDAVKSVDNLTERERLAILGFHAVNVEQNIPKGIGYAKMRTELYPDDPATHNTLGWYYQRSGQIEEALKEYKTTVRINPNMALSYGALIGIYLDKLGNADSALVWSEKMISDNPQNAWSYTYLGSAWLSIDSLMKAEAAYEKARELNPDLIINLYRLASTYRLQGNYNEAIGVLKKIPDKDLYVTSPYYELGVNYQLNGNQEEAHLYFNRFKKIATGIWMKRWPDDPGTYISISAVMAHLGEMDSSKLMLQKAIQMDSTLHDRFAEVLCLQGNVPEALNQLEKAFTRGYRDLFWLKLTPDLQILQYDIRFRNLIKKYFP